MVRHVRRAPAEGYQTLSKGTRVQRPGGNSRRSTSSPSWSPCRCRTSTTHYKQGGAGALDAPEQVVARAIQMRAGSTQPLHAAPATGLRPDQPGDPHGAGAERDASK